MQATRILIFACVTFVATGCTSGGTEVQPVKPNEEKQAVAKKTGSCPTAYLMNGDSQVATVFKVIVDKRIVAYLTANHAAVGQQNKKLSIVYRCGDQEVIRKIINTEKLASLDAILLSPESDISEMPALSVKAAEAGSVYIPTFTAIGDIDKNLKGVMVPLSGSILLVKEGVVYFKVNGIRPGASGAPILKDGDVVGLVVGRYLEKNGGYSEYGYGIDIQQIFKAIAARFPGSGAGRL